MKNILFIILALATISCTPQKNTTMESAKSLSELNNSQKPVSTQVAFLTKEGKVISLQILKNQQLAEHTTKVPALLVCVKGYAIYSDENGKKVELKSGTYYNIPENIKHKVYALEDSNFLLIK